MASQNGTVGACGAGKPDLQDNIDTKHNLSTLARLEEALDSIRPFLNSHLGDVSINEVDDSGKVKLTFTGACTGCPNQALTFAAVVLPALKKVPGITDIDSGVRYSDAVIQRITKLYGPRPNL